MSGTVYRTPLRSERGLELVRFRSYNGDVWFTVYLDGIEVDSFPELKPALRLYRRALNDGIDIVDEEEANDCDV